MNEDRVIGAGKELLGKGEQKVGGALGSSDLQADGIVDQVAGVVQHGFGQLKDGVASAVDNAPDVAKTALDRSRSVARRFDDTIRDQFGESGPTYVLAGAIALLAVSLFFVGRRD